MHRSATGVGDQQIADAVEIDVSDDGRDRIDPAGCECLRDGVRQEIADQGDVAGVEDSQIRRAVAVEIADEELTRTGAGRERERSARAETAEVSVAAVGQNRDFARGAVADEEIGRAIGAIAINAGDIGNDNRVGADAA